MKTLKVPEMHCENCVSRIKNALNAASVKFEVSLDNKTISVDGDDNDVKIVVEALDDLGFDVET